jgi:hypothetical protein
MRFARLPGFMSRRKANICAPISSCSQNGLLRPRQIFKHKRRYRCRQITDAVPPTRSYSSAVHGALDWIGPLQTLCRAVLSEGKTAMADYRCYLVNSLDQIQSATELECAEDSEAMLQAGALAQSQSLTVEIWNGARLVGRVPRAETQR